MAGFNRKMIRPASGHGNNSVFQINSRVLFFQPYINLLMEHLIQLNQDLFISIVVIFSIDHYITQTFDKKVISA